MKALTMLTSVDNVLGALCSVTRGSWPVGAPAVDLVKDSLASQRGGSPVIPVPFCHTHLPLSPGLLLPSPGLCHWGGGFHSGCDRLSHVSSIPALCLVAGSPDYLTPTC